MACGVETRSPDETEALGEAWGRVLVAGDVLLLSGDLGSGKTTLVRGLSRGLGVERGVKSPSFAIHLEYPGRITLHHLDLYRLGDPRDLDELGLEDVFGREGVAAVEWGDRLGDRSPAWAIRIRIEDLDSESRKITVSGPRTAVKRLADATGLEVDP